MNKDILFAESQRFKQWWLWSIVVGINVLFLYGVYVQIIAAQPFGNNPMTNTQLLIATIVTILLTFLFFSCRLDTIIRKDGIYVRFFPFHLKFRYYNWQVLKKFCVRHYSPIPEYGGWGLRLGLFGKGVAYSVSGDMGLQLEFTNNKNLLIGTNKPAELSEVINKINELK
jgi:hypothetical protein